ncbi:MAG: indole-3-glycerol-phosphate synthase [Candidatus Acetothermia bacterium]
MNDVLTELASSALERVESGYYEINCRVRDQNASQSFVSAIRNCDSRAIVAEIKPGSPTAGKLFGGKFSPSEAGRTYLKGGAAGLSVLTDPDHFYGSLSYLAEVSELDTPVLMKDFVLHRLQLKAAKALGADAVLLIYRLFDRGCARLNLPEAIDYAHELSLEVLLEVNGGSEYKSALNTQSEMIGINNRDLRTLEVDLKATDRILGEFEKDRLIWSMSGISEEEEVEYLKQAGADAFLVGTSLARAGRPEALLRSLCGGGHAKS